MRNINIILKSKRKKEKRKGGKEWNKKERNKEGRCIKKWEVHKHFQIILKAYHQDQQLLYFQDFTRVFIDR